MNSDVNATTPKAGRVSDALATVTVSPELRREIFLALCRRGIDDCQVVQAATMALIENIPAVAETIADAVLLGKAIRRQSGLMKSLRIRVKGHRRAADTLLALATEDHVEAPEGAELRARIEYLTTTMESLETTWAEERTRLLLLADLNARLHTLSYPTAVQILRQVLVDDEAPAAPQA